MSSKSNKTGEKSFHRELVITRVFDAPREKVWKTWTEPGQVKRWHGPKVFTCPVAEIDFRVGGKYLFCMRADQGPEVWQKGLWSTGVYKEITPLEKLVCTDSFADEEGNVVPATHYGIPDNIPLEMNLTVTFEDYQGKTRMTLIHQGFPEGEMSDGPNQGWNESFDKLEELLTNPAGR